MTTYFETCAKHFVKNSNQQFLMTDKLMNDKWRFQL